MDHVQCPLQTTITKAGVKVTCTNRNTNAPCSHLIGTYINKNDFLKLKARPMHGAAVDRSGSPTYGTTTCMQARAAVGGRDVASN